MACDLNAYKTVMDEMRSKKKDDGSYMTDAEIIDILSADPRFEEIAKQGGIKKIIVRSAKNATYSEIKGNSEPGEAGYTIYDVNARRCKYKKNEETGNYEKEI
jgi:hypothetical protein